MNYFMQLGLEAFIVGIVFVVLFVFVEKLGFDTTDAKIVFLIAVIGHVLFELTGTNRLYCEKGAACQ